MWNIERAQATSWVFRPHGEEVQSGKLAKYAIAIGLAAVAHYLRNLLLRCEGRVQITQAQVKITHLFGVYPHCKTSPILPIGSALHEKRFNLQILSRGKDRRNVYKQHAQAGRFIYKVRGECQASIIELSDGSLCVLKLANDGQPNLLFNEAFGSELMRHFNLPIAEWVPIVLTNDFIDSTPDFWQVRQNCSVRPSAGLHFGSKFVTSKTGIGTYQIIPSSWFAKLENAEDFVHALAIDIWSNHCDKRQAIFASAGPRLHATFIDNGHMFGGPLGSDLTCPRRAMLHDLRMYQGFAIEEILESWRRRLVDISEDALRSLLKQIPTEWYTEQMAAQVIGQLLSRLPKLRALFSEAAEVVRAGYSVTFEHFVSSLEPGLQQSV